MSASAWSCVDHIMIVLYSGRKNCKKIVGKLRREKIYNFNFNNVEKRSLIYSNMETGEKIIETDKFI